MNKSEALNYRATIERAAEHQTDEEALDNISLYPKWDDMIGQAVAADFRLRYKDILYRVLQPHTIQADWNPADTPALFTVVSLDEWPEIPEVITAENAWMKGQKGTWKEQHYICQIDNCVWNPDQYPAAWELQS